jgi:hypothetical protein
MTKIMKMLSEILSNNKSKDMTLNIQLLLVSMIAWQSKMLLKIGKRNIMNGKGGLLMNHKVLLNLLHFIENLKNSLNTLILVK